MSSVLSMPGLTFAQDHLVPEAGILNAADYRWSYSKKLRTVLLREATPYFTARLVCIPSFDPEWMVTVIRECEEGQYAPDHPHTYFVEYTGAEKSLWYAKKFRKVNVKRVRANFDRETAEAVAEVWRRMLRDVRYPEASEIGRVEDATTMHFSRAVPVQHQGSIDRHAGFEEGYLTTPTVPPRGPMTRELIAIGEALRTYALSEAEEREKLLPKIRAQADQLLAKLDKPLQP
jgi:hypothetical protein